MGVAALLRVFDSLSVFRVATTIVSLLVFVPFIILHMKVFSKHVTMVLQLLYGNRNPNKCGLQILDINLCKNLNIPLLGTFVPFFYFAPHNSILIGLANIVIL